MNAYCLYAKNFTSLFGLREIRECLKLDADHKNCHTHYKKVKKLVQQIQSAEDAIKEQHWNDCISSIDKMLKIENEVETFLDKASSLLCHCHSQVNYDLLFNLKKFNCLRVTFSCCFM